jgi:riboflavin kinase / FMN adenylyltransferase
MKIIRNSNLKHYQNLQSYVATIGNFDGVHLGHQAIIKKLLQQSSKLSLPSLVIIFEPQPEEYFKGEHAPARLTKLKEKLLLLQQFSVENVLILRFNQTLATKTAAEFMQYITAHINIKHLIIGDDFHFGHKQEGNFQYLKNKQQQYKFSIEESTTITLDIYKCNKIITHRISSSWVRQSLKADDFAMAKNLLGRAYTLSGRVVHGHKRGRALSFPTANIYLHRKKAPLTGVFLVNIHGINDNYSQGIANIGKRPTIGDNKLLLEVHIFNFNQEIYNKYISIQFIRKIRDEKKFKTIDELKAQITQDIKKARTIIA